MMMNCRNKRWRTCLLGLLVPHILGSALILSVVGCGDEPIGNSTSMVIGPDGGTITHEKVELIFPKGAVLEDTTITITTMEDIAPSGYSAYSPIYQFEPKNRYFRKKVTAIFEYQGNPKAAALIWSIPGASGWYSLGGTFSNNKVTAKVRHFSMGFAGLSSSTCGSTICANGRCWTGGCAPNHCDPSADNSYDIWQDNCHSAANSCVMQDPDHNGIVACGGDPKCSDNPGNHTFNYIVDPLTNEVQYWNWGGACSHGPCPGPVPSSVPSDPNNCHLKCIKDFCGSQFDGDEEIYDPGQTVEIPGPSTCATSVSKAHGGSFKTKYGPECLDCCDKRADVWPNNKPSYQQRGCDQQDFRSACKTLCMGFFEMPDCPYLPSVQACDANGGRDPAGIKSDCISVANGYNLNTTTTASCKHVCMDTTLEISKSCPCPPPDAGPEAGQDASMDGEPGLDTGLDAGPGQDIGLDAGPGPDTGLDAGPGPDIGLDAGPGQDIALDAGPGQDIALDAGPGQDTALDAGPGQDTGLDAGPGPDTSLDAGPGDSGSDTTQDASSTADVMQPTD
jgi:hypothetical protein